MLHLISILSGLLAAPAFDACDLNAMPVVDVATHQHELQLQACLVRRSVWLRASPINDARVRVPGGEEVWMGAVRIEQSRLLSASAFGVGYKIRNSRDEPITPVGLYSKQGTALFDGVSLENDLVVSIGDEVTIGRVFFAVDWRSRLVRLSVLSRGKLAFGYYWVTNARLPIGTPIFTARGEFVSIVGLTAPDGRSLLLPKEAFDRMFADRETTGEP